MTPSDIVAALDQNIVGQPKAKRAVAIALRNRWRRLQVAEPLRHEITPKNILMIGPTGVGKTEIARRLAKLANAPFVKVEATKFTEVGYVGREVDAIIKDLMDVAVKEARAAAEAANRDRAAAAVEERLLDLLLPRRKAENGERAPESASEQATREKFRGMLRQGDLEGQELQLEVQGGGRSVHVMAPPGMAEMAEQLQSVMQSMSRRRTQTRKMKVEDARPLLLEEEADRLLDDNEIHAQAIHNAEQNGIVFIDEIDKVVRSGQTTGTDISREGVQRDLLPLVEGCAVNTRYGMVKTDHMLFIASGAFHVSKPSDMLPELQGRFPIRVELDSLTVEDFVRILTEPAASLCRQYQALLETEGVHVDFTEAGVRKLAEIAFSVNKTTENIGARRLHTVMERLLDPISFGADTQRGETIVIDAALVEATLGPVAKDEDLSRYIL